MDSSHIQLFLQLLLAVALGSIVGLEREYKKKEAGLQTYSLVALGSCLFTILACELFRSFSGQPGISFDPSRVVLAVATGIGFLGAGVIIYRQFRVEGLTTAAGLWATAAIGVAVGIRLYTLALFATFLSAVILIVFAKLENKLFGKK